MSARSPGVCWHRLHARSHEKHTRARLTKITARLARLGVRLRWQIRRRRVNAFQY